MDKLQAALFFWFGCVYGSFLNVLIHRLPKDESVVFPGSKCPHCGASIAWFDNIPLASWLLLKGKGRCCRKRIAFRYPLVELASGLLFAALAWRWPAQPLWAGGAALACGALLAVALIDWETFIIPDELSLGLVAAGLVFYPVNPYFDAWWQPFAGAAVGFLMAWGVAVAGEAAFKKEALGGGDVKLLAGVGAWTGAVGAFDCLMIGSFLGSIYGVALLLRKRARRSDPIPFGPFLAAGAALNFFYLLPLGWPILD